MLASSCQRAGRQPQAIVSATPPSFPPREVCAWACLRSRDLASVSPARKRAGCLWLGRLTLLGGYPGPVFSSSGGGSPAAHLRRSSWGVVLREGLRGARELRGRRIMTRPDIQRASGEGSGLLGIFVVLFSAMTGISDRSERRPTYRLRLAVLCRRGRHHQQPHRVGEFLQAWGRRHTGLRAGAPIAVLELVLRGPGVLGEVYCKVPLPRKVQTHCALSWLCHRTGGVLLGWKIVRLSKRAGRGNSSASSAALPVSEDEAKGGHLHLQRTALCDVGEHTENSMTFPQRSPADGCRCSPTVSWGTIGGTAQSGKTQQGPPNSKLSRSLPPSIFHPRLYTVARATNTRDTPLGRHSHRLV